MNHIEQKFLKSDLKTKSKCFFFTFLVFACFSMNIWLHTCVSFINVYYRPLYLFLTNYIVIIFVTNINISMFDIKMFHLHSGSKSAMLSSLSTYIYSLFAKITTSCYFNTINHGKWHEWFATLLSYRFNLKFKEKHIFTEFYSQSTYFNLKQY